MRDFNAKPAAPNSSLYTIELTSRAADTLLPIVDARIKFIEARIPKCKQPRVLTQLQEELLTLKQGAQVLDDIIVRHREKLIAQLHEIAKQ